MQSFKTPRIVSVAHRTAAVLADPKLEVGLMIREILRSLSVHETFVTDDVGEVVNKVEHFACDLVVIDDTTLHSAPLILREFLRHPICSITPTMVLLSNANKPESNVLASLIRPMIIEKPLSPGRFANGYKALTKVWTSGFHSQLSSAIQAFKAGEKDEGMRILTSLTRNPNSQAIVTPCITGMLKRSGNTKAAEKILLSALKLSPRDAGLTLGLSDLYLNNSMPSTALRLLKNFENTYGQALVSSFDKLQAFLMLQDIEGAIPVAQDLLHRDFTKAFARSMLVKMLYTEGRINEVGNLINDPEYVKHITSMWNPAAATAKAG